ncbi:hypothetical protein D9M69_586680 [compost metagenome]
MEKIATLPGVFSPSITLRAVACGVPERNFFVASSGSQASLSTPATLSMTLRMVLVLFTALATCTTTGMPANWPCTSVEARKRSASLTSPFLNLMALARSMVCGKSRFHSCGGVYGHLVM